MHCPAGEPLSTIYFKILQMDLCVALVLFAYIYMLNLHGGRQTVLKGK